MSDEIDAAVARHPAAQRAELLDQLERYNRALTERYQAAVLVTVEEVEASSIPHLRVMVEQTEERLANIVKMSNW